MEQDRPNFFAGAYLDRRAEAREDPEWLAAARADAATLYLVGQGTTHLLYAEPPRIAFVPRDAPLVREATESIVLLLGWFRGVRCLLIDLPPGHSLEAPAGMAFREL